MHSFEVPILRSTIFSNWMNIAEKQLLHLAQIILFPVELKLVTHGKTIKSNSKIFTYSSFLEAAGFLRFTGFIRCLEDKNLILKSLLNSKLGIIYLGTDSKTPSQLFSLRIGLHVLCDKLKMRQLLKSTEIYYCAKWQKRKAVAVIYFFDRYNLQLINCKQPVFHHRLGLFRFILRPHSRSTERRRFFALASPPGIYTSMLCLH